MEHYGTELIEMLFKELTREEDLEISRLDGYDAGVKRWPFSKGEKSGFSKGENPVSQRPEIFQVNARRLGYCERHAERTHRRGCHCKITESTGNR